MAKTNPILLARKIVAVARHPVLLAGQKRKGYLPDDLAFIYSVAQQIVEKNFVTVKQLLAAKSIVERFEWAVQSTNPLQPANVRMRVMGWSEQDPYSETFLDPEEVNSHSKRQVIIDETYGKLLAQPSLDRLVFEPMRYPTKVLKHAKFRWDSSEGVWIHKGINRLAVERVEELLNPVLVDQSVYDAIAAQEQLKALPTHLSQHPRAYPFQKEATQFLLSRNRAMLALAPGLGKSVVAILALQHLLEEEEISNILIVAPKSLLGTWRRLVDEWAGEPCLVLHDEFDNPPDLDTPWHVTNYASLVYDKVERWGWDAVVIDESIYVKNPSRHQVKGKGWVFKTKRVQAAAELAADAVYCWELSGGPTSKFLDDLWAQFHILDPERFSSYWRFANEHCQVDTHHWGKDVIGDKPGEEDRIKDVYRDIYFSRGQDDVLDLPDWIFADPVEVPMDRVQADLYNNLALLWYADLNKGDPNAEVRITTPNVLANTTRLLQLASNPVLLGHEPKLKTGRISAKWHAAIDQLQFHALPAILWVNYRESARLLAEYLANTYSIGVLTGDTPSSDRDGIVQQFQRGSLDVLVAHPAVGKFGHTLTAARTAIYLERSWNSDDYYQSLHRVRRIGSTHRPVVVRVLSTYPDGSDTVDHLVDYILEDKTRTTFTVTQLSQNLTKGGQHGT